MIIRKHCAVLEDANGCSICSLVGDTEFIYNSVKQTINEFSSNAEEDERLKFLVENGKLVYLRHYIEDIHDNTPAKNVAKHIDKVIVFPVVDILNNDFASREHCVAFEEQLKEFSKVNEELLKFVKQSSGGVSYVES